MGALASLAFTACDGSPQLTGPAEVQTFVLNLNKESAAKSREPHTVTLDKDRSLTITTAGHRIRIKGKSGSVDGRIKFTLTDRLAAHVEDGISELEYKQSKENREMQSAAARCMSNAELSTDRLGDTSVTASASIADQCAQLVTQRSL